MGSAVPAGWGPKQGARCTETGRGPAAMLSYPATIRAMPGYTVAADALPPPTSINPCSSATHRTPQLSPCDKLPVCPCKQGLCRGPQRKNLGPLWALVQLAHASCMPCMPPADRSEHRAGRSTVIWVGMEGTSSLECVIEQPTGAMHQGVPRCAGSMCMTHSGQTTHVRTGTHVRPSSNV